MSSVRETFLPPGAGPFFHVLGGDAVTVKATAADTGGAFTLLETKAPPWAGPPLHEHSRESETFYVLEGEFEFVVGDRRIRAETGSVVMAPTGVPHRFQNVSGVSGRLLIICEPAGFEHFIEELAALSQHDEPDMARIADLGAKFGIRFPG